MTSGTCIASVPVQQSDRDAAADYGKYRIYSSLEAEGIRAGRFDADDLVQAFASYRFSQESEVALLMAAIERLANIIGMDESNEVNPLPVEVQRQRVAAAPILEAIGMELVHPIEQYEPGGWCFDWQMPPSAERAARAELAERLARIEEAARV